MNIVLSVNAAWNIWNFRRPLVEALLADNHTVTVLAPKDDTAIRLAGLGCRVHHLRMDRKGLNPVQNARLIVRMRQAFQELRADVVLSFTIKNNIFGALAARSIGVPFVPNVTGLGTTFLSGSLLQSSAILLHRLAFRRLPIVFFQNEDDRDLFVEKRVVSIDQAVLLPGSGIDLDHFAGTPYPDNSHAPIFLMIARLLRDKGIYEYIEAARRVKSFTPEARFQLLGAIDTENRTAISQNIVRLWEDEGLIEYLGTTDDVRPVIAKAHCIVLPSYREGAPRTLIEAAAMGRPLIATDVPGCRAVVDDETTGYLCKVRSSKSLVNAIATFISLPEDRKAQMGQFGRRKMEREYDQRLVCDAYRAALLQLAPMRRFAT